MKTLATTSTTVRTLTTAVAAFALLAILGSAQAALITSGNYDEDTYETNTVDQVSTNSDYTLSGFKTELNNAFSNNRGGVIHFDDVAAGTTLADADSDDSPGSIPEDEGFDATYGTSQSNTLRVYMGPNTDRVDSDPNFDGKWSVADTVEGSRIPVSGDADGSNQLAGLTDCVFVSTPA